MIAQRESEPAVQAPPPAADHQPVVRDRDTRRKVNETLWTHGQMTTEELAKATSYSGGHLNLETNLGRWPETKRDEGRRWILLQQAQDEPAQDKPAQDEPAQDDQGQDEQGQHELGQDEPGQESAPPPTGEEQTPLSQDEATEPPDEPKVEPQRTHTAGGRMPHQREFSNSPEGIRQATAEILEHSDASHPMPARTIYSRLLDKGFPTGEGQPIHQYLAHLATDLRFREEPAGQWTLRKEELPEATEGER